MIQVLCLFTQVAKCFNLVGQSKISDYCGMILIHFIVLDHVDQDSKQEDSICQQIKEKIANRKGATSIVSIHI